MTSQAQLQSKNDAASATDRAAGLKATLKDLGAQREAMESEIADISERLEAPGMPGLKGSLLDKQGFPRSDIDVAAVRRDRHRLICLTNDHRALSDRLAGLLGDLHAAMREAEAKPSQPAAPPPASSSAPMDVDGGATSATNSNSGSGARAGLAGPAAGGAAGGGSSGAVAAPPPPPPSGLALAPFALVDEVTAGSPASRAGLQVGDLLCSFGEVSGAGASDDNASPSQQQPAAAPTSTSTSTAALLQRVAGVLAASEGRAVAATVLRQGAPVAISLTPQRWAGRGLLGCHLKPL